MKYKQWPPEEENFDVRTKRRQFFYFDDYIDRMSTSTINHRLLLIYIVNIVQISLKSGYVI